MLSTTSHTIIIVSSITAVTVLAAIDLFKGGDGATITGAFTTIGMLVGYTFGKLKDINA